MTTAFQEPWSLDIVGEKQQQQDDVTMEEDCWDDIELPEDGLGDTIFGESSPDDAFGSVDFDTENVSTEDLAQESKEGMTVQAPEGVSVAKSDSLVLSDPSATMSCSSDSYPDTLDLDDDDEEDPFANLDLTTAGFETAGCDSGRTPLIPESFADSVQRLNKTASGPPQAIVAWENNDAEDLSGMELPSMSNAQHTPVPAGTLTSGPLAVQSDLSNDHALEALDMDFDIPDDAPTLKLTPMSFPRGMAMDIHNELDLVSDGWGDSLSIHKDLPSMRLLSSPTPSSAASIVASESEEDTFDDLEFPDSVEALRLGTYHHAAQHGAPEPEGDDNDDPFAGLLIPNDMPFQAVRPKTGSAKSCLPPAPPLPSPIPSETASSRSATPSKIPRIIPSLIPSPTPIKPNVFSAARGLSLDTRRRDGFVSSTTFKNSVVSPISPSVGHIQRLSSQLIASRRLGTDASRAPSKLLRTPANNPTFGDGTELDEFDDLLVSSAAETKFVKKTKAPITVAAESPTRQGPLKRPLSKSTSTASIVSGDERENRRPYTPLTTVNPRPAKNFVERRGGAGTQKKRQRKKPTLIQNLNNTGVVKVVGDMVYNPTLHRWEGNEDALLEFERASPSRPALITNVGGYKMSQSVGGMIFDPVRMCWLGNNEDADVFADFPDDMSVTSDGVAGPTSELTEFQLSKSLREAICIAESSHKLFMGNWYPKAILDSRTMIRDTSKTHLYEIRSQTKGDQRRRAWNSGFGMKY